MNNPISLPLTCAVLLICSNPTYSQEGSSHKEKPPQHEGSSHPDTPPPEGSSHKEKHPHHEGSSHKVPHMEGSHKMMHNKGLGSVHEAVGLVKPTAGNNAEGSVKFHRRSGSLHIVADIQGLTPSAKHAIHIHEFGDCSSGDGKSAGGHYNPEGHSHAGPENDIRHAGDLGNLVADENGSAHYELTVDNISIGGSKNPIIGRAVVIHAGEDDLKSQPTGDAGARIGCGVIGVGAATE